MPKMLKRFSGLVQQIDSSQTLILGVVDVMLYSVGLKIQATDEILTAVDESA
jgi:hypothetical protein